MCTCTPSWLLKNSHLTDTSTDPDFGGYKSQMRQFCDTLLICNFAELYKACNITVDDLRVPLRLQSNPDDDLDEIYDCADSRSEKLESSDLSTTGYTHLTVVIVLLAVLTSILAGIFLAQSTLLKQIKSKFKRNRSYQVNTANQSRIRKYDWLACPFKSDNRHFVR
jgi:hypothetical protein